MVRGRGVNPSYRFVPLGAGRDVLLVGVVATLYDGMSGTPTVPIRMS